MRITLPLPMAENQNGPYYFNLIDSAEVMRRLGYTNVSSFHRARQKMGFKPVRLNGRKIMFVEKEVHDWVMDQKERRVPPS